jgi:hypothetical protein
MKRDSIGVKGAPETPAASLVRPAGDFCTPSARGAQAGQTGSLLGTGDFKMAINYSIDMKAGIPIDSLEYDEIVISRSGEKIELQFWKGGKELFSQPIWLAAEGDVFRFSGIKGSLGLKLSSP